MAIASTGAQMMAILNGRDPDLEEYYGVKGAADDAAEAPAHLDTIIDDPIPMSECSEGGNASDAPTETSPPTDENE